MCVCVYHCAHTYVRMYIHLLIYSKKVTNALCCQIHLHTYVRTNVHMHLFCDYVCVFLHVPTELWESNYKGHAYTLRSSLHINVDWVNFTINSNCFSQDDFSCGKQVHVRCMEVQLLVVHMAGLLQARCHGHCSGYTPPPPLSTDQFGNKHD